MFEQLGNRNKFCLFWGGMDLLALLIYLSASALRGRIPLYSDAADFLMLSQNFSLDGSAGLWLQAMLISGLVMKVSLVFSAYMFLFKDKLNFILLGIQEALRFATFSCSVSLLPLFLGVFDGPPPVVLSLSGFLLSECGKIGSLWWYYRHPAK